MNISRFLYGGFSALILFVWLLFQLVSRFYDILEGILLEEKQSDLGVT